MSRLLVQGIASHVFRFAAFLAILTLLASCASAPRASGTGTTTLAKGDKTNPWVLEITWKTDACKVDKVEPKTKSTCVGLNPNDFCVNQGKWVQWASANNKKFRIYFSPFKGSTAHAGPGDKGKTKKRINDKAPPGLYKYSILADGCDPTTDTFDPHIRVGK